MGDLKDEPEEFMSNESNNTDPVRALIDQWRNSAENGVFTGGAGPDIRETLMECADELEAALASEPPEDRFEQFVQAEIARSPNALRELGCYLADVLDEDRFPRANRLLLQLATEYAPPSTPAPAAVAVAYRDALYGTRWIKQLRDMEPGTQWFIEGRAEPIATVTSHASVTWHMAASEIPHGTAYYTAPPSAPMGVAYLDIGAGGYMDLGSELSDEELAKLPYGRHVLGIIGTHGVDGYVLAQQPADALGGVRELVARCRAEADAAYVAYIRKMDTDECRGWEAKVRAGTFARANLDAFTAAAELLSRSRALHAFASRLEAALAAQQQGGHDHG